MEILNHYFELYIGHILLFLSGLFLNYFRLRFLDIKFRKFFGAKRNKTRIKVAYGQFCELVTENDKKNPEFANAQKIYSVGEKKIYYSKRFSEFVGALTIKSVNYISRELLKHKHYPSKVCTDIEAINDFACSFISIGGPAVNELTQSLMDRTDNRFFEFEIPEKPADGKLFNLYRKNGDKKELIERIDGFDYGLIIRLDNKHEHDEIKDCVYFICAGLGSHGTCGACYFLANNWKKLYKEFKDNEFGILLKVRVGAVTDVHRIESNR